MTETATITEISRRTREEWLMDAVGALTPLFEEIGESVPAMRVSVGFPHGRGGANAVIGQAWAKEATADNIAQVFIAPSQGDAVRVLDILVHEMIHVIDGNESGHRGRFARIAKTVGLEGKMTATVAGEALRERLEGIAEDLGAYPHAVLAPLGAGAPKKQTTRMLKTECAQGSGYIARLTRKWLEDYGAPICPCHEERMVEA